MSNTRGAELLRSINKKIIGRAAISEPEAELIVKYTKDSGIHYEIGCLWGGTTLLALLAGASRVHTVDMMKGGFWDTGDPAVGLRTPSAKIILQNFTNFGVSHRVSIYSCKSHPLPMPTHLRPETAFIDGGHTYKVAHQDWLNLKDITRRYILFHDWQRSHQPVQDLIENVVMKDEGWTLVERARTVGVFQRNA